MKRWFLALSVLALAACEREAQVANSAAECQSLRDRDARIAACTTAAEDEQYSADVRAEALATRASLREEAGEVTPALRDYEAAQRLDADNVAALLGRGRILLASGQLDAAEPLLVRAQSDGPSADASEMLGQIALRRSQYQAALEHFDAALDAGRFPAAMAGRARAKQRTGDLDGATADYDAAVRMDGALAEARAGRCWLDLNQDRNLTRARSDADAAIAADPANVEGQLCRGVLHLREGAWADARASFDAVLAIEPGNPTALFGRGVARRRSGDNAGREDMNLARDFDRHIGATFDDMGVNTF
ncbi:MAG: tetratricopeptide repeat protein [Phycisphaerales bacterium]|nr:tetratricopeptide repeat protein [Hyphomonadaceae bacterium]